MKNEKTMILIPSYEPDETLARVCESLYREGFTILVVDDGSGKEYHPYFEAASKFAEVIGYETNKGKGFALKYGMKYLSEHYSSFSYFITVDGDGQHDIEDIVLMSKNIEFGHKIIIGERDFKGKIPPKSLIGNWMSKVTQALASKRYLSDNQCGLRAFPFRDICWLINSKENRYEYEMDVLSKLIEKEIPFETQTIKTLYEDNNSKTHFRPFVDTILIQSSILKFAIINILMFALEVALGHVFANIVFSSRAIYLEVSVFLSFSIALILMLLLKIIIYKPKHIGKMTFKTVGYKVFLFAGELISIELLTRIAGLPLFASYLIGIVILLPALFFLIEGFGLAFELN